MQDKKKKQFSNNNQKYIDIHAFGLIDKHTFD